MIELSRNHPISAPAPRTIKILGLGGAGSNAIDRIQLDGHEGAGLVALNTDMQSLAGCVAPEKVQLGMSTTRGLGAGGDPEIGYHAAEEGADAIRGSVADAAIVFVCVGLGGGTGSGAAPLVAALAREEGALVVVFATLPFTFEGRRRMAQAEEALAGLYQTADLVICFENDKMADAVSPRASVQEAFAAADLMISQSVRAVVALVQRRGLIHVGFDELSTALRNENPRCVFGFGEADGDNRAHLALERALKSPLMDRGRMLGDAANVLINVSGGPNLTLNEVQILMDEFNRHVSDDTRILFGMSVDPKLGTRLHVTIVSSITAAPALTPAPPIAAPRTKPLPEPVASIIEDQLPELPAAADPEPEDVEAERPVMAPAASPGRLTPMSARRPPPLPNAADARREARQEQMQFEPVTRGRFEKSEPTIVDGQDLDVPTFLRRNGRSK